MKGRVSWGISEHVRVEWSIRLRKNGKKIG